MERKVKNGDLKASILFFHNISTVQKDKDRVKLFHTDQDKIVYRWRLKVRVEMQVVKL